MDTFLNHCKLVLIGSPPAGRVWIEVKSSGWCKSWKHGSWQIGLH